MDPELEKQFSTRHHRSFSRIRRMGAWGIVWVVGVFALLSPWTFSSEAKLSLLLGSLLPPLVGAMGVLKFNGGFKAAERAQYVLVASSLVSLIWAEQVSRTLQPHFHSIYPAVILLMLYLTSLSGLLFRRTVQIAAFILSIATLFFVASGYPTTKTINASFHILAAAALGLIAARIREKSERSDFLRELQLGNEKSRMKKLIQNVFPESIGQHLVNGEWQSASRQGEACVLFVDLVGFTAWSKGRPSETVVAHVTEIFARFDLILQAHGIEKIKTIGDGYLAVCNLPEPLPESAQKAVSAAQDILASLKDSPIGCRIGIATGPVSAGVVALKRSTFDVWGPVVNLASRLEGSAAKNEIRVCSVTATRVASSTRLSEPDEVDLKGLGPTRFYRVLGLP